MYFSVSCIQSRSHFMSNPRPPIYVGRETSGHAVDSSAIVTTPGCSSWMASLSARTNSTASRFSRLSLSVSNRWNYAAVSDIDEFTSEFANAGQGRSDGTSSSLSLSYQLNEMFDLGASMSSSQPWKRPDNKSIYPPIFNFSNAEGGFTTFEFRVGASI